MKTKKRIIFATLAFLCIALLSKTEAVSPAPDGGYPGGNTAICYGAGVNLTTANSVICIGHDGQNVTASTWIENVYGATTQSGTTAPVIVSDNG